MFGNCCGCNKKSKRKKTTKDAETQSCNDLLTIIENDTSNEKIETEKNISEVILIENKVVGVEVKLVTDQPIPTSDCKRQSNASQVKIEISDDDDDVFCEGVGPPIKLAENLATPKSRGQPHIPLPTWFSLEEDDNESGGIQEPPATPIGKDELALRRSRYLFELVNAAQSASEHKVHFDPLGPVIAGTDQVPSQELEHLVTRLENITVRLESVCLPVQELFKLATTEAPSDLLERELEISLQETPSPTQVTMSVQGYQDIIQGPLAQFVAVSQQIGGDVATHGNMVKEAFNTQLQYLVIASESAQPSSANNNNLILPTGQCILKIQEFREKSRGSNYFNHLSAISESIPALGWVAVSPAPAPYVKEMNDAGQFYTNRVLKDWKEKDRKHMDWVKAWIQTLTELQAYVKQHHTTGLVWGGKKAASNGGSCVPPPPGPPPPPVPLCDFSDAGTDNDRSALFAQINQGENITKSLKKVTDEMQTHKNPTLRTGPAPFKAPQSSIQPAKAPVDKPPSFVRDGKKWLIEYQKDNNNLLVEGAEMNNVVYLYKCTNSTIVVKGKLNSITLDSCKKTSVVFDSLVSCIEFINCQSVQMQVIAKVPTISIDKTDGCQMYLSNESLGVEIVSSKSSEMNVLVPKPNGDYAEYPIPEQYKTTIVPGKGLSTIIVENKGGEGTAMAMTVDLLERSTVIAHLYLQRGYLHA